MEDDTVLHSFGKHRKKSLFQILEESMQDEHSAEVMSWNLGTTETPHALTVRTAMS